MDRRKFIKINSIAAAGLPLIGFYMPACYDPDETLLKRLEQDFITLPDLSKPWCFWIWLSGNISFEGITKDLEEMKSKGVGGVLIYEVNGGKTIPKGYSFLGDEWRGYFRFALKEIKRLGLRASLVLCDGWDCGGPWITPEYSNKKIIYNQYYVKGGKSIKKALRLNGVVDDYYRDIAVLAFRKVEDQPLQPVNITASSSSFGYVWEINRPPYAVMDGDPETYWESGAQVPAWLKLEYDEPLAATGLYIAPVDENGPKDCELKVMKGGIATTISRFTMDRKEPKYIRFPEILSKEFTLEFSSSYDAPVRVANVQILRKGDKPYIRKGIKWWDFKSGKRSFWDWPVEGPAALLEEYAGSVPADCRSNELLDISKYMDAEGMLNWNPPAGNWTILRFGYTLVGQKMRTSDSGYEADVLSSESMKVHFRHVASPVLEDIQSVDARDIFDCFSIDSYEIGADVKGQQPTWSDGFREEFKSRRGYDLLPFLPALAYKIVDSREATNRFLWDMRRTIADLFADRFWKTFNDLSHEHNIRTQVETGYGTYPYPHIDGLQCAGMMDVPMGEFWYHNKIMSQFNDWGHVNRTVATAGHVYGRNIIATEAFTSYDQWADPASLKPLADEAFCAGINRMVLQQYTHQPKPDIKPGNQFGAGTHMDKNITWWKHSGPFFAYLGRCQHLLQQGSFVADVVYYYGESATNFVPGKAYLDPPLPAGYDFDTIDTHILMNRIQVKEGQLELPHGMRYLLMVLRSDAAISYASLKKIRDLVAAGATVIGSKPKQAPGLFNYPRNDKELQTLIQELWGDCDGEAVKERRYGKGRIICGKTPDEVLSESRVHQDFEYTSGHPDTFIDFIHRSTGEAEIYFLANRTDRPERIKATFRIAGMDAEIWDPVTGSVSKAVAFEQMAGLTTLPLDFAEYQSLFIVFKRPATFLINKAGRYKQNFPDSSVVQTLNGPWKVKFDPEWGGPSSIEFKELQDWTEHPEEGIKYYSGSATYVNYFDLSRIKANSSRFFLNLGVVRDIACVSLNGKTLPVIWTAPWQVEITDVVQQRNNILEVEVTNQWTNRIIGDGALPPEKRYAKTNIIFPKDRALQPSGLLGPVTIQLALPPALV